MIKSPRVSAVAAIGSRTRAIGKNNKLLWNLPEDLKRFERITRGHPVIMGRLTFQSILNILGRPLPGRVNIVISRRLEYPHREVRIVNTSQAALQLAQSLDQEEVFVIGGGQIYEQLLPATDRLYLTLVESDKEGDAWFPEYEHLFTKEVEKEVKEYQGLKYAWLTLDRN